MPVKMQGGKMYATVQERLVAAHGENAQPAGITSIETEPIGLPGLNGSAFIVIKATVTFEDGRVFTGLAEAPLNATKGAEMTNPIEVGETSAVGRALAMAGYYGSDTGLAGAEEMKIAAAKSERRTGPTAPPQRPAPTATKPTGPTETKDVPPPATKPIDPVAAAGYYLFLVSVADEHNADKPEQAIQFEDPPPKAPGSWFVEHGVPLKKALLAVGFTKEDLIAPSST